MEDRVDNQLRASGWFPGRSVELTSDIAVLENEGFATWDGLLSFLAEYTGLVVASEDGSRSVWISVQRAVAEIDPEWGRAYSEALKCPLVPVGGYSHMSIYLGRDGVFYGGFDNQYGRLAIDLKELVDALLNNHPHVSLDQELE